MAFCLLQMILVYYMKLINKFLFRNLKMKDMGVTSIVIGIERVLGLSQKIYINKILERFRMDKCYSIISSSNSEGDKFILMQCHKNEFERKKIINNPYYMLLGV